MGMGGKSKAAVLVKLKKPLQIWDIQIPEPGPGQVLVRVQAAGLCGSQLFEMEGLRGPDNFLPHLLGHEGAGRVEAVGAGVTKVKRGDFVVLSWIKGLGQNVGGGSYIYKGKKVNAGGVAVFAEQAIVSENRVTKISRKLPPEIASLLGCAVATGAGAIRHTLQVSKGATVAIFGVGGVGASAIIAAAFAGAREIVAVDVSPKKLRWAGDLGATFTINAVKKDAVAEIKKKVPGGVDYALEASGIAAVGEQAFVALNDSGTLAIAGHPKEGSVLKLPPYDFIKGKKVVGTWGGGTEPDIDFPWYAKMYLAGKLPLEKLITHRYRLAEINQAFATLKAGQAGRIILTLE